MADLTVVQTANSTAGSSGHADAITAGPITTTPGNLLIVVRVDYIFDWGSGPPSDNYGNTWTEFNAKNYSSPISYAYVYFAPNCRGGPGHTFTISGGEHQIGGARLFVLEVAGLPWLTNDRPTIYASENHNWANEGFLGILTATASITPSVSSLVQRFFLLGVGLMYQPGTFVPDVAPWITDCNYPMLLADYEPPLIVSHCERPASVGTYAYAVTAQQGITGWEGEVAGIFAFYAPEVVVPPTPPTAYPTAHAPERDTYVPCSQECST